MANKFKIVKDREIKIKKTKKFYSFFEEKFVSWYHSSYLLLELMLGATNQSKHGILAFVQRFYKRL